MKMVLMIDKGLHKLCTIGLYYKRYNRIKPILRLTRHLDHYHIIASHSKKLTDIDTNQIYEFNLSFIKDIVRFVDGFTEQAVNIAHFCDTLFELGNPIRLKDQPESRRNVVKYDYAVVKSINDYTSLNKVYFDIIDNINQTTISLSFEKWDDKDYDRNAIRVTKHKNYIPSHGLVVPITFEEYNNLVGKEVFDIRKYSQINQLMIKNICFVANCSSYNYERELDIIE